MKAIQHGIKIVFGIPGEERPIVNAPHGCARLILKPRECAKLEVNGVQYLLEDCGDTWKVRPDLHETNKGRSIHRDIEQA